MPSHDGLASDRGSITAPGERREGPRASLCTAEKQRAFSHSEHPGSRSQTCYWDVISLQKIAVDLVPQTGGISGNRHRKAEINCRSCNGSRMAARRAWAKADSRAGNWIPQQPIASAIRFPYGRVPARIERSWVR